MFIKIKDVLTYFLYFLFVIYSVEILLFIFSSNLQKSLVNIKEKRIQIAKKNNLRFDPRESEIVFFEKKNEIEKLSVPFYYSSLFSNLKTFKEAKKNNKFIPFRGPINKKTLSCAEDLEYKIIENDKYGFKNSNSIYEKKINVILLGASHAEGFCYTSENDIAGNLIKKKINTLNLGVAATGPLVSLAVLKEFGPLYKPKNIIYLYFESNNLDFLKWEKEDKYLIKYLKKDHRNNYTDRLSEIEDFLDSIEKESIKIAKVRANQVQPKNKGKGAYFIANIRDILEINILRSKFKKFFLSKNPAHDLNLFFDIVYEMKAEAQKLNAKFIFVYVPNWERFFNKNTNLHPVMNLKTTIIESLSDKQIDIIDLTGFFGNAINLNDYYPLGFIGHFNEKGYKKIADIIKQRISD